MVADSETDFLRLCQEAALPEVEGLPKRSCGHPSALAWCKRSTSSPAGLLQRFLERLGHSLANGIAHPRDRHQVKGLLNAAPILFRNQDRVGTFPGYLNRFVRAGRRIQ